MPGFFCLKRKRESLHVILCHAFCQFFPSFLCYTSREGMYRRLFRGVVVLYSRRVVARCVTQVPTGCCCKGHHWKSSCFSPVLVCQRRLQSSTDKKYHCSLCKKAFRLEMAAKLHLRQAHGGDGSVEAGPGPGVESEPFVATGVPPAAPPSSPIQRNFSEDEERRPRRMRPTPKPLHEPDLEVPYTVMEELLGVWDTVGLSRLDGNFVHSTMILKVFAAPHDVSEQPLYDPVTPQGDNPFERLDQIGSSAVTESYVGDSAFSEMDLKGPFAAAPDHTLNPFCAKKVQNPFTKSSAVQCELSKPVQQRQQQHKEQLATAPVTPFGQLPLFGKQQESREPIVVTPQKEGTSDPLEVSSPFAADVVDSPFAGKVVSPFATTPNVSVIKPFEVSPFTAASPFLAAGTQESSPFAPVSHSANFFVQGGSDPSAVFPGAVGLSNHPEGIRQEQSPPLMEYECPTCGKKFSSFEGASMHSKAKHGVALQTDEKRGKGVKTGRGVPDLPAYIPSPVDLSATSPFGTKSTSDASWVETELIPHAQCMSNITIVGRVLDVTHTPGDASQVTVFVQGEEKGEEETLTLCCTGDITSRLRDTLKRNVMVFVCGTLRLHPVYEASNNKYYVTPLVHVALPTGTLAVIT